jgi:hypothetical protein
MVILILMIKGKSFCLLMISLKICAAFLILSLAKKLGLVYFVRILMNCIINLIQIVTFLCLRAFLVNTLNLKFTFFP